MLALTNASMACGLHISGLPIMIVKLIRMCCGNGCLRASLYHITTSQARESLCVLCDFVVNRFFGERVPMRSASG